MTFYYYWDIGNWFYGFANPDGRFEINFLLPI